MKVYKEKDKKLAPLLLACSFLDRIEFIGYEVEDGVVSLSFSPEKKALKIIEEYKIRSEEPIPAKVLFEAIDNFWEKIKEVRSSYPTIC